MTLNGTSGTGDDLDDGLEYAFDPISDIEEDVPVEALEPLDEEDDTRINEAKRKRSDMDIDDDIVGESPKNAKKNHKKLKKQQQNQMISDEKTALAYMDTSLIADYVAHKVRRKNPDLSGLELNDLYLKQSDFVSTASFHPSDRLDKYYSEFIMKFNDTMRKAITGRKRGKLIIILAMSAIRACDIHRCLKSIPGGSFKLIKKNQVKQDESYLQGRKSAVAVATAGRINALLEKGILDPKRIQAIVVDSSYLNEKIQNIWDIDDTIPCLHKLVSSSGAKLHLY